MLIVDAHEDLAWNILTFGRDYSLSAAETRQRELGTLTPARNDDTLLGWPDYQRGCVAVVFGTLFAAPERKRLGTWENLAYADDRTANRLYRQQIDTYSRLVDDHPDKFRLVHTRPDLQAVVEPWRRQDAVSPSKNDPPDASGEPSPLQGQPVGLVLLMEGAEGIMAPGELEEWWARGLRVIGPAWAGNRFCGGTREPGPLTPEGYALLEAMAGLGFGLDLTHMDEKAALQALEVYPGPLAASHSNALALLKGTDSNRFLSDRVIRGLVEREGLIGVVPFNAFLQAGWKRGDRRTGLHLEQVVAHIDYICQMAGDARHVGLGSDFDGGFGLQSVPEEIDTVADLQKLGPLLLERGYREGDVAGILGENWLGWLGRVLPETA